jgi:hypothetical protein
MTAPLMYGTHFHTFPFELLPLLTQSILIIVHHQTQNVGSETQRVAYYIGYPQIVVQACIYSSALLTIPVTSALRSVSLDFEDFAFGTSWTQNFNYA